MRSFLLLVVPFFLAGCPGDEPVSVDSGAGDIGSDAREGGVTWDSLRVPDLGTVLGCEVRCLARAPRLCVGDPADSAKPCVECLKDSHCFNNPGALGPRCDTARKLCVCLGDNDCFENLRGRRCDATHRMCTCAADSDCRAAFPFCAGLGATMVCTRPCAGDSSCTDPAAPRCDRASGRCVECLEDSQCQAHPAGTRCRAARCGCTAATPHCAGTYPWGKACAAAASGGLRCACASDSDCSGNPHGPTCHTSSQRCTCAGDADCKKAPYTRCYPAYGGAAYSHCQAPCKDDQQCARELGLRRCASGKCLACIKDADCPAATPRCAVSSGRCVACLKDADCSAAAPHCGSSGQCLECETDQQCAASPRGGLCTGGACGCSAAAHCQGTVRWGKACPVGLGRCGCAAAADCSGQAPGPICDAARGKCTCQEDKECEVAPYKTCKVPYSGAVYKQCQQ